MNWMEEINFYGPIFLLPVEDKIGFKTQQEGHDGPGSLT